VSLVPDYRTLLLVLGGLYLLLPLIVWLVLRMPRRGSALLWCAGGMLGGVGFLLMGTRGVIPDALSYLLGHPLLLLAALLTIQSLRLDLGRPWPWRWLVALTLVYAGVLAWLLPVVQPPTLGMLIRAVNLSAIVCLVVAAWRVGEVERSRNAQTIAVAYAVQAVGIVMNLALAVTGSDDIQTLSGGVLNAISALLMVLVVLVATMSYLGLALERLSRSLEEQVRQVARQRYTVERREALETLERERTLSTLADALGNDLTQPLTAGLLHVQMGQRHLQGGAPAQAQVAHAVARLIQSLEQASDTVEHIRRMIKPEPSHSAPLKLEALLIDVECMLGPEAAGQGVSLAVNAPAEPVWLKGDASQLSQALVQGVRNAMAAVDGAARKQVSIEVALTDQDVLIHIQDSGPGFPAEVLRSGWAREAQRYLLKGIGLFVIRNTAQQHGGAMELSNPAKGGARLTIRLPRHAAPLVREAAPPRTMAASSAEAFSDP
jgi:signal transduction histidine kinase